ncbi:uncharacterized protein LOC121866492 isoform X2 [Homarus americanus]|nr:uncharacterized protein LOC121866492 isoform X2 [Homarus americanus]
MVNCVVQEVIEVREQRAALQYLSSVMPLVPLPLPTMVHLITLCGAINTPSHQSHTLKSEPLNLWLLSPSALQGILPGTLWCGKRDQATYYHELGQRVELDACCRAHDHCPIKVRPLATRYGFTNLSFITKSHCICDLELFRCLKAAKDPLAATVGQVYFNILRMQCLNSVNSYRRTNNPPDNRKPEAVPFSNEGLTVKSIGGVDKVVPQVTGTSLTGPKPWRPSSQQKLLETGLESSPGYQETTFPSGPRLECTLWDGNGGCRMWLHNPKGFTTRYAAQTTSLVF